MIRDKSFEEWCLENEHQDFLDLWDYDLNDKVPSEVSKCSKGKCYFKCRRGLHESALMKISTIYSNHKLYICKKCNSFAQWCIDKHHEDILQRWDYELNKEDPFMIPYAKNSKYYFKCPCGKHDSELKSIVNYVMGHEGVMDCRVCKSFGQYCIDIYGDDFMDKYWSDKNTVDPFSLSKYNETTEIWIKCQKTDYHGDYNTTPFNFSSGNLCPFCHGQYKVHYVDSIGYYLEQNNLLNLYAEDNVESLYSIAKQSHKDMKWHCNNGIHNDYVRNCNRSMRFSFQCPECASSQGELKISRFLVSNNIDYIPQKTFDDLVGIRSGLLSYDFYLPEYNVLVEFQGQQHEEPVSFNGESEEVAQERFEIQQEHDRRKRQYAANNNINLLEIWYYDFDNIENILTETLDLSSAPQLNMKPKYRVS